MKNGRFFAALLLTIGFSAIRAQVITTLQHAGQTTVYYSQYGLSNAVNAAANGDTIYLSGGHFNAVSIYKRIAVFGAGHYPDSTLATGITWIDGGFELGENADSTHLEGLRISGSLSFAGNASVNYVKILRNYIDGSFSVPGDRSNPSRYVLFAGNCVNNISADNTLQCEFASNIIGGPIHYANTSSIRNNNFYSWHYYGWPYHQNFQLYDCDNSLIENNIFSSTGGVLIFSNNSLLRNNLFFATPSGGDNTCTFESNYENVSEADVYVNHTGTSFYYSDDFHLKSPATYLGRDGFQVGIYGGANPYREAAMPVNPHISEQSVGDNTDSNGNLQINIKVSAQQE